MTEASAHDAMRFVSEHAPAAASVALPPARPAHAVQPSLRCRRCVMAFIDASALRAHWSTAHGARARSSSASSDGSSTDGSSESPSYTEGAEDADASAAALLEADDAMGRVAPLARSVTGCGAGTPRALVHVLDAGVCVGVSRVLLDALGHRPPPSSLSRLSPLATLEPPPDALGTEAAVGSLSDVFSPGETWLVMLYRGGYFAGVVVEVVPPGPDAAATAASTIPPISRGGHAQAPPPYPRTLLHRRFARYTTRRKQGGSQAAHDASSGRLANSMGAQLRRANAVALVEEVHSLLAEWAAAIQSCRRILISAAATTTADLFDGVTLARGDPRVSRVPLTTTRPTVAEAERVARVLSRVTLLGPYAPLVQAAESTAAAALAGEAATRVAAAEAAAVAAAAAAARVAARVQQQGEGVMRRKGKSRRARRAVKGSRGGGGGGIECSSSGGEGVKEEEGGGCTDDGSGNDSAALPPHTRTSAHTEAEVAEACALEESLALARAEERASGDAAALVVRVSALSTAVGETIARLAPRFSLPTFVLLRALDLPTPGSSSGVIGRNAQGISLATLEAARESLCLLTSLRDESGLAPSDALTAMGWDTLGAAAGLAAAGVEVDWEGMAFTGSKAARAAAEDFEGDARNALRGGRRKKGGGAAAGGGGGSKPQLPPLPPPPARAPKVEIGRPPPPTPAEERERRRNMMAAAAEARIKSAAGELR